MTRRHRSISGDSHSDMLPTRGNHLMSHNSSNSNNNYSSSSSSVSHGNSNNSVNTSSNLLVVVERKDADDIVDATAKDVSATHELMIAASRLRDVSGRSLLHDCQDSLATAAAVLDRAQQLDEFITSMPTAATASSSSSSATIATLLGSSSATFSTSTNNISSSSSNSFSSCQNICQRSSAYFVRQNWLVMKDQESGYTPLHSAVYRGDLASLLLLLRHALSNDVPRMSVKPMPLLESSMGMRTSTTSATTAATTTSGSEGNSNSNSNSNNEWIQAVVTAKDFEGMTAADLMAARQRQELQAVRTSLYRPVIRRNTTAPNTAQTTTSAAAMRRPRRLRRSSFDADDDVEDDEDDDEQQNELHELSQGIQHLQAHNYANNDNHSDNGDSKNDATKVRYGCEVLTFGRAHHCALGVVASTRMQDRRMNNSSSITHTGTNSPHSTTMDAATVSNKNNNNNNKVRPNRVQAFSQSQVGRVGGAVAVAGATHHTLVATLQGHLYAFGLGKGGRLGTGDEAHCPLPTRVRGPLSSRRVVAMAAADNHSLCVTACGSVYAWGSNRFGQVGTTCGSSGTVDEISSTNNRNSTRCLPRRVDDLKNVFCVGVAAGEKHSVALSRQGEVYVWGDNTAGQLATSRRSGVHKVQRVDALWNSSPPKAVIAIAASEQATMVLTAPTGSGIPVNSIYSWGHGNHSLSKLQFESSKEHRGRPINPVAISCARYHCVAITSDGLVYSWGLHAEPLGTPKSKKTPIASTGIASPQLVLGMLPENGGGIAVAVSASENHTAVLTETGALFTWGATYVRDILGHEGVRWQPDPKRVPGVYRAVGVAAAKEHTVLLVGATFPPVPPPLTDSSLENLAARRVAEHVDLFNVLPILIMAERTQCSLLLEYCTEFVRRNLDGVLNVGQRCHMDCYLNEQLVSHFIGCDGARDERHHPFLLDVITAGNAARPSFENGDALSSTKEWISACSKLSQSTHAAAIIKRYVSDPSAVSVEGTLVRKRLTRPRSLSTHSVGDRSENGSCSERCLELTSNMDLSSKVLAEAKHACILKEMRWVRKRLGQIAKLLQGSGDVSLLTEEQLEKLSRQPQLHKELLVFEPALAAVEKRLKEYGLVDAEACKKKVNEIRCSDDGEEKKESKPSGVSKLERKKSSFRCETCQITCPDENSHSLHINGRKHRNRVAVVVEKEQQDAAASIKEKMQRQVMVSSAVLPHPHPKKCEARSPWKSEKSSSLPKYKLPPPPHPCPDGVVSTATSKPSGTKSLRDIMAEESQKPKSSAQVTPIKSTMMTLQVPQGTAPTLQSSPWKSSTKMTPQLPQVSAPTLQSPPWKSSAKIAPSSSTKMTLQLPHGSAPTLQSPPWASPVARVPVAAHPEMPKVAYSLGDFLKPEPRPPTAVASRPAGWTSPKAKEAPQDSLAGVSFRDIQQQEHEFKTKQDQTYGDNSSWFIERRERAGSFKEIENETAKELEERLFIEEQLRIEKEIQKELAAKKAHDESKTRKRSNKTSKPKNRKPKPPPEGKATSPNHGKRKKDTTKGRQRTNTSGGKKGNVEPQPQKILAEPLT